VGFKGKKPKKAARRRIVKGERKRVAKCAVDKPCPEDLGRPKNVGGWRTKMGGGIFKKKLRKTAKTGQTREEKGGQGGNMVRR